METVKTRLARDEPGGSTPILQGWRASKVLWYAMSGKGEDGDLGSSKDLSVTDVLETTEEPENGHVRIWISPPKTGAINSPTEVHLHNACNMSNKQEELEAYGKLIYFPSCKHGGMTCTTGVLQWMATNLSERIGQEGEAVG